MKNRLDLHRLAELDRQLSEFAKLQRHPIPRCGWTKTVRLALGMSSKVLGIRVAISAQGVRKLEQAEADGSITLKTLAKLAHGLDCEVRYVFVPRTSLMNQVLSRAHELSDTPGLNQEHQPTLFSEEISATFALVEQINRRDFW